LEHNLILKFKTVNLGLIFIILFIFPAPLLAKREHPERWYQQKWCEVHRGQVEVVLPDGTCFDCVTDTHTIEFDFGDHWSRRWGKALITQYKRVKERGLF
jgi:hypothetical protein